MIKIALTGGIGCGKSTVCDLFTELGVPVIDTDIIARELVKPETEALKQIISYFGSDILLIDGSLNRKLLASKIFNNKENRLQLESILHPKIRQSVEDQIKKFEFCYVIIAIPLLVETNQHKSYDRVLLIDCDERLQLSRTLSRDSRDLKEIKAIINSQASRKQRINAADDIIDNCGDLSNLRDQVEQLHLSYLELCNNHF